MNTNTSANNQLTAPAREHDTSGSVTSTDGTTIGYRQLGHGPGVVLLHGTASSGYNHIQLAEALADAFTVYVPDRRILGLSGPYSKDYTIQKEVEDVDALLTRTGAHHVFGVSSGGIICLQAALTLPAIHKAAIYEPPLFIKGAPIAVVARFDQEMADGKVAAALITGMKAAQLGQPIFNVIPRRPLELLTDMTMEGE